MDKKIEITNIKFSNHKHVIGTFHRIDIEISDPTEEHHYNTSTYCSFTGYNLTNLIADMIDKLNNLDLEVNVNE